MVQKKYLVVVPGIILAFVLYTLSQGFNNIIGIEFFGYEKSPISTAMIAILIGIFFGNAFQVRESFQKGLDFTKEYILKFGIICLGIQLKPFEFLEFGKIAIPLIIVCIISVLIVIKLLIKKLKIPTRMAYLISIGSTVCGTTAIMATAPVIKANKNEVSYAIANITLFGILSMLIYPYFANIYFDGQPLLIGLFLDEKVLDINQTFDHIRFLNYPKDKTSFHIIYGDSKHEYKVNMFKEKYSDIFKSFKITHTNSNKIISRKNFLIESYDEADYVIMMESNHIFRNIKSIQLLINECKGIISPMINKEGSEWVNFESKNKKNN